MPVRYLRRRDYALSMRRNLQAARATRAGGFGSGQQEGQWLKELTVWAAQDRPGGSCRIRVGRHPRALRGARRGLDAGAEALTRNDPDGPGDRPAVRLCCGRVTPWHTTTRTAPPPSTGPAGGGARHHRGRARGRGRRSRPQRQPGPARRRRARAGRRRRDRPGPAGDPVRRPPGHPAADLRLLPAGDPGRRGQRRAAVRRGRVRAGRGVAAPDRPARGGQRADAGRGRRRPGRQRRLAVAAPAASATA